MSRTHSDWKTEVDKSLAVLRDGGTLLYPTDTVWGLGCDATNPEAVAKLLALKERPEGKALVVLIDDASKLNHYLREVPEVAWDLVEAAVDPLTIIYPGGIKVAKQVMGEDGTLAIRVCQHPFCQQLIRKLNRPLVSTSANRSGMPIPQTDAELDVLIANGVDYRVAGSINTNNKPSSLIQLGLDGGIKIVRS